MPASSRAVSNRIWTIPNQITTARLVLSIVVFAAIGLRAYLTGLIVFIVAAATDWVDGYWARRYNEVSKVGRIFDPFVDKIIICGSFIFLAAEPDSRIVPWMAVVVVGRELLVTALRGAIEQAGGDFSANFAGKLKMVFQCAAVIASLLVLWYKPHVPHGLDMAAVSLIWLAVLSTVYSGGIYVRAAFTSFPAAPGLEESPDEDEHEHDADSPTG